MYMNKTKIIATCLLVVGILFLAGCGCKKSVSKKYSLSLEVWGPLDNGDALNEIFDNYKKINPNISGISYKKISSDTYKTELLDALASGQGPDIFMINNAWLDAFEDKISFSPTEMSPQIINEQKFKQNFVDVAAADFINDDKIYAVPLSVDSLGLYYNKNLFNQAGITAPPTNWNEFIEDVKKLTKINSVGEITLSGAAIGTAYNINRSTDVLTLLMLQNGTKMIDDGGRPVFDATSNINGKSVSPGEEALNFYTQFSDSRSSNYAWNSKQHYSLDAFMQEEVAMMFNYSWHLKTIEDGSPKLNFSVAPVPQFSNSEKVNYANYWGFAVAKNKIPKSNPYDNSQASSVSNDIRIGEAWLFLTYLTTKPDGTFGGANSSGSSVGKTADPNFDPAKSYLSKSGEPSARRDLIELQKSDPRIGVFATDNLIGKSWRMPDPESTEAIFATMIDAVNKGQTTVFDALHTAARRVDALREKK